MLKENNKAPIHMEEIISSTPSHLENPSPAPTATTQTGQTALAIFANVVPKNKKIKNNNFLFIFE